MLLHRLSPCERDLNMKIAVLDAATLGSDLSLAPLSEFGEVSVYATTSVTEAAARVADAEMLVVNKFKCNAESLASAQKLRLICEFATGFDNIDLAYCREKGIAVCNVVGYSTHSVAQVTVSMVLSLANRLREYDAYVKSGTYTQSGAANAVSPVYHELQGKTWGIFGFGNIGKQVALVAEALGCRILVCKRNPAMDYPCVSLDELCEKSDILTIHTPLTEETRGAFDAKRLSCMKKNAILVNVARGAVVDEAAVASAVLDGRLGAYGCDVYSAEPMSENHPYQEILHLPNVLLTPHMAWGAYEARERCLLEICDNIRSFLNKGERNRVDL